MCNYKKFHIVAKDGDEIIGALAAYTAFSEIYVDDIWIDPVYRKHGIGCRLLKDLEHRFTNKGYNNINLVTSEFTGASLFYKKCGFELEFVRINKRNPNLSKYFFIKYFTDENQYQGIAEPLLACPTKIDRK